MSQKNSEYVQFKILLFLITHVPCILWHWVMHSWCNQVSCKYTGEWLALERSIRALAPDVRCSYTSKPPLFDFPSDEKQRFLAKKKHEASNKNNERFPQKATNVLFFLPVLGASAQQANLSTGAQQANPSYNTHPMEAIETVDEWCNILISRVQQWAWAERVATLRIFLKQNPLQDFIVYHSIQNI